MSDLKTLEELLATADAELEALFEKRRPLDEAITKVAKDREALTEEHGKLLVEKFKQEGPDWALMLADTGKVSGGSMAVYRYFSELLRERFDMYLSGYFEESQQGCAHIKIDRACDESERKTLEGVKTLLPFLKPFADDDCLHLPIWKLEEMLHYHLVVKPDLSEIRIMSERGRVEYEAKTLEDAISYVRKHLWYEDSSRENWRGEVE